MLIKHLYSSLKNFRLIHKFYIIAFLPLRVVNKNYLNDVLIEAWRSCWESVDQKKDVVADREAATLVLARKTLLFVGIGGHNSANIELKRRVSDVRKQC